MSLFAYVFKKQPPSFYKLVKENLCTAIVCYSLITFICVDNFKNGHKYDVFHL